MFLKKNNISRQANYNASDIDPRIVQLWDSNFFIMNIYFK